VLQKQHFCPTCGRPTLFARENFAFGFGCLASLLTGCAFLPIWGVILIVYSMRPYRCQVCGAAEVFALDVPSAGVRGLPALEFDGSSAVPLGARLRGVLGACVASVRDVYRSLPEWAGPIVWGLGIASPLVSLMFLWRWLAS
jgi:hypothetical protein